MENKVLLTVRHMYEAVEIKELLKNNGLPCEFREYGVEAFMRIVGWTNYGGHGIDILVPESCFEEAAQLTKQFAADFESGISDEELEAEAMKYGPQEEEN